MNIHELIAREDLNEDLQMACEELGIENIRLLIEKLPGVKLYIPSIKNFKGICLRYITDHPNQSLPYIASLFKVSVNTLNKWLKDQK